MAPSIEGIALMGSVDDGDAGLQVLYRDSLGRRVLRTYAQACRIVGQCACLNPAVLYGTAGVESGVPLRLSPFRSGAFTRGHGRLRDEVEAFAGQPMGDLLARFGGGTCAEETLWARFVLRRLREKGPDWVVLFGTGAAVRSLEPRQGNCSTGRDSLVVHAADPVRQQAVEVPFTRGVRGFRMERPNVWPLPVPGNPALRLWQVVYAPSSS